MSDIVYVSPQIYLLSKDKWKSSHQKPGFIPILSADVPKFQQSLSSLSKGAFGDKQNAEDSQPGSTSNAVGGSQITESQSSDSGRYQSLKHFFPIGLQQQLHTFSLLGLSSTISDEAVESFLQKCVQRVIQWHGFESGPSVESWTNIRFSDLQYQDVFVRLDQSDDKAYAGICKTLEMVFPPTNEQDSRSTEFHCDTNTRRFIDDQDIDFPKKNIEELSNELVALMKELENRITDPSSDGEIFHGESRDYQIDFNTLSDLPRESLSQLCKDIMEFRTRVVSIEKEKRIKESYEESRRRKNQMMQVFDRLRKSNKNATGEDQVESDNSDDDQDEADGLDEDDDLSAEKQKQNKEKEESEQRYQEDLKNLYNQIEPRLAALHRDIKRQQNYEKTLAEERTLHLKQLLHQANDPYYDHHRTFKISEEQKDDADRKLHGLEIPKTAADVQPETEEEPLPARAAPAPEQIKIKFAFKKAIDTSAEQANEDHSTENASAKKHSLSQEYAPSVLDLNDETLEKCLRKIKDSRLVDELVKEYLGVYEDELVEYIFDNIREHKNKQVLLDDLKETFDEDAVTIVDKMWSKEWWDV